MIKKLKEAYLDTPLAYKIRYSYFLILLPALIFVVVSFSLLWRSNRKYDEMINAATTASQFSLDFKNDFDYETYLLIVENKSIEESGLGEILLDANNVVTTLELISKNGSNDDRLKSAKKYLRNLETYKARIEENIRIGNMYEENIQIWENDVQIVTALLRESMVQYIYYEIQDMKAAREAYQKNYERLITGSVIGFFLVFIAVIYMSFLISNSITKPIKDLSEVTNQVANGDLTVRSDVDAGAEIKVLGDSLNSMIDKINELLNQVTEEQIRLKNAELELLQAQINPHFLYNTLDAIVWLAESGEQEKVVSMVGSLSDFFRTCLSKGKEVVTIREELLHVKSYLSIQHVRYQDIMEYEINIPQELNEQSIPKMTLQPLVENALYHGIKNKRGKGNITISGEVFDDYFVLYVKDNGIGMAPDRLTEVKNSLLEKSPSGKGVYGLYNVNERIKLKFGDRYGISIESTYNEGSSISVKLPLGVDRLSI